MNKNFLLCLMCLPICAVIEDNTKGNSSTWKFIDMQPLTTRTVAAVTSSSVQANIIPTANPSIDAFYQHCVDYLCGRIFFSQVRKVLTDMQYNLFEELIDASDTFEARMSNLGLLAFCLPHNNVYSYTISTLDIKHDDRVYKFYEKYDPISDQVREHILTPLYQSILAMYITREITLKDLIKDPNILSNIEINMCDIKGYIENTQYKSKHTIEPQDHEMLFSLGIIYNVIKIMYPNNQQYAHLTQAIKEFLQALPFGTELYNNTRTIVNDQIQEDQDRTMQQQAKQTAMNKEAQQITDNPYIAYLSQKITFDALLARIQSVTNFYFPTIETLSTLNELCTAILNRIQYYRICNAKQESIDNLALLYAFLPQNHTGKNQIASALRIKPINSKKPSYDQTHYTPADHIQTDSQYALFKAYIYLLLSYLDGQVPFEQLPHTFSNSHPTDSLANIKQLFSSQSNVENVYSHLFFIALKTVLNYKENSLSSN